MGPAAGLRLGSRGGARVGVGIRARVRGRSLTVGRRSEMPRQQSARPLRPVGCRVRGVRSEARLAAGRPACRPPSGCPRCAVRVGREPPAACEPAAGRRWPPKRIPWRTHSPRRGWPPGWGRGSGVRIRGSGWGSGAGQSLGLGLGLSLGLDLGLGFGVESGHQRAHRGGGVGGGSPLPAELQEGQDELLDRPRDAVGRHAHLGKHGHSKYGHRK